MNCKGVTLGVAQLPPLGEFSTHNYFGTDVTEPSCIAEIVFQYLFFNLFYNFNNSHYFVVP